MFKRYMRLSGNNPNYRLIMERKVVGIYDSRAPFMTTNRTLRNNTSYYYDMYAIRDPSNALAK